MLTFNCRNLYAFTFNLLPSLLLEERSYVICIESIVIIQYCV